MFNYSSEMVDADIVTQDNEVIEAGENINVENADEEACRLMREMPKWIVGIKEAVNKIQ